ncbi:MAG: hypothetical protein ACREYC_04625 [Gammaproteobacteria bacterium]
MPDVRSRRSRAGNGGTRPARAAAVGYDTTVWLHTSAQDGVSVDRLPYVGTYRRGSDSIFVVTLRKVGYDQWDGRGGDRLRCLPGQKQPMGAAFYPHRLDAIPLGQKGGSRKLVRRPAPVSQAKQPSKLAPGEAGVERRELRTLAGYRDLDGDLHVVSAVCTHLGCTVAWNKAELSWDCPFLPRFPVRCRR